MHFDALVSGVPDDGISTYNELNRLVGMVGKNGNISYSYRPDGLRASKTVGSTTTTHFWDLTNIAAETTGGVTTTYLRGVGLIASKSGSTYTYYDKNSHGDTYRLLNSSGMATKTYVYDAFGTQRSPSLTTTDANPFRYCGEYFDNETGSIYLRMNNPIYYTDPSGYFVKEAWSAFLSGVKSVGDTIVSFAGGVIHGVGEALTYGTVEPAINAMNVKSAPNAQAYQIGKIFANFTVGAAGVIITGVGTGGGIIIAPTGVGAIAGYSVAAYGVTLTTSGTMSAIKNITVLFANKYKKPDNPNRRKGAENRGPNPNAPGKNEKHGVGSGGENHSQRPKGGTNLPKRGGDRR